MTAHDMHVRAEHLREQDKHLEALNQYDAAIIEYQKEHNYAGIVEAFQGKFLTYKHLYLLTNDDIYLTCCRIHAEISRDVATPHHLPLGSIYFRFGELYGMLGRYEQAIESFHDALTHHTGIPAEKGDYRYHLGEALYRNGNREEGRETMLEGIAEIQLHAAGADSFLIHTWESGGYMRLAELIYHDDPHAAHTYLEKAQVIIDNDDRLIIRRRQIQKLRDIIHSA